MILRFDRRLYSRESVEAAATAFEDLVPVSVRETGEWVEAEARGERAALDEACDGDFEGEFANQALAEAAK